MLGDSQLAPAPALFVGLTVRLLPLYPPSALCQRFSTLGVGVQIAYNKYLFTIVVLREMNAFSEISEIKYLALDRGTAVLLGTRGWIGVWALRPGLLNLTGLVGYAGSGLRGRVLGRTSSGIAILPCQYAVRAFLSLHLTRGTEVRERRVKPGRRLEETIADPPVT